ncbi:unnamed protein product [Amoebophrya sp. A120]|nr:unnamed protein product [Amoebophrya sp. A120]|eukprot:GSA120T00018371001.1
MSGRQYLCGTSAGGIDRGLLAKARATSIGDTGREDIRGDHSAKLPSKYLEYQFLPLLVFVGTFIFWVHCSYALGFAATLVLGFALVVFNVQIVVSNLNAIRLYVLHVSTLSLPATLFGGLVGLLLAQGYFYSYAAFGDRMQYLKMKADHPATGVQDAAGITFENDVAPDLSMVVGLKAHGEVYCVAPVLKKGTDPTSAPPIQFWAVGTNCCEYRYKFQCGQLGPDAHAGLVRHDFSNEVLQILPMNSADRFYRKAVDVATSLYPVSSNSTSAVLVEWTKDASDNSGIWWAGFYQALLASFCFFLFTLPLACILAIQYDASYHQRLHAEQHF